MSFHCLCLYTILLGFILTLISAQNINEDCDDGKGTCSFITNCPSLLAAFDKLDFNTLKYCDRPNMLLCCPKTKKKDEKYYENYTETFQQKCQNYSMEVYPKCDPIPLIVGGTKAAPKEFPHMALLGFKNATSKKIDWLCGGTLISNNYVITSAHCFARSESEGAPNYVRLGELDYDSYNDDARPQNFSIKNYAVHPDYEFLAKYNDVALVQLDANAKFDRYVAPACLPIYNGTEFNEFTATGFGAKSFAGSSSSHLLKVSLERFEDDECAKIVQEEDDILHARTQICAGSRTDKRDTCTGDSGGPLFVTHPDFPCMYLLVGITTHGYGCGTPNAPGVYTRVNRFVEWVERVVWGTAGRF